MISSKRKKRRKTITNITFIITLLFSLGDYSILFSKPVNAATTSSPVQQPISDPGNGQVIQPAQPSSTNSSETSKEINDLGPLQKVIPPQLNQNKGKGKQYSLPEGVVGEYPKRRTQNSKVFLKDNGHLVQVISAQALHYQDANGDWQEIDNTLKTSTENGFNFQNTANRFNTLFSNTIGNGKFIRFKIDNKWLDFEPIGANKAASTSSGNEILYSNVYDGVDFHYSIDNSALKEDIILNSYQGKK